MHDIITTEVLGSPMDVFVFRPQGPGPHPGLLLAMHLPGHNGLQHDAFTLQSAQRFADNGFVVAVPFLFHWWPLTAQMEQKRLESRDDLILEDMKAGLAVLKSQQGVDATRLVVAGHCWGGRVAWLTACHIHEFLALASFYGGNIKKALGAGNQPPIELARYITCPVLGFYGNEDSNPSPQDVEDYSVALSDAGVVHEFHQYDGAGHAFQNFAAPERFHAEASADAWDKVLGFLTELTGLGDKH
jgi:carboxymethylenebutenolidase